MDLRAPSTTVVLRRAFIPTCQVLAHLRLHRTRLRVATALRALALHLPRPFQSGLSSRDRVTAIRVTAGHRRLDQILVVRLLAAGDDDGLLGRRLDAAGHDRLLLAMLVARRHLTEVRVFVLLLVVRFGALGRARRRVRLVGRRHQRRDGRLAAGDHRLLGRVRQVRRSSRRDVLQIDSRQNQRHRRQLGLRDGGRGHDLRQRGQQTGRLVLRYLRLLLTG